MLALGAVWQTEWLSSRQKEGNCILPSARPVSNPHSDFYSMTMPLVKTDTQHFSMYFEMGQHLEADADLIYTQLQACLFTFSSLWSCPRPRTSRLVMAQQPWWCWQEASWMPVPNCWLKVGHECLALHLETHAHCYCFSVSLQGRCLQSCITSTRRCGEVEVQNSGSNNEKFCQSLLPFPYPTNFFILRRFLQSFK